MHMCDCTVQFYIFVAIVGLVPCKMRRGLRELADSSLQLQLVVLSAEPSNETLPYLTHAI